MKPSNIENIVGLASWVLFGFGLALSDMLSPDRIRAFFDLFWKWDPTLAFVLVGAVAVSLAWHFFLKRRSRPFFWEKWHFSWERKGAIDRKLILGSAIFGIGWAIAGLCPGPAVGSLVFANPWNVTFLVAMLASMWAYVRLQSR